MSPIIIGSLISAFATIFAVLVGSYLKGEAFQSKSLKHKLTNLEGSQLKDVKLKISLPVNQGTVTSDKFIPIKGTIDGDIPPGIKLFVLHHSDGGGYYPQGPVKITNLGDGRKTWESYNYFNRSTNVSLVSAGSGGQMLFKYYGGNPC